MRMTPLFWYLNTVPSPSRKNSRMFRHGPLRISFTLISKNEIIVLDVLLHEISLYLSLYLSLNSSQLLNFWEYCTVTMKIHARSSQILTQAGIATSGLLSAWRFIRWTMMVNKTVPTVVTITNVTYISTNICHNCHNDGFLKQLILCIVPIVHYIS